MLSKRKRKKQGTLTRRKFLASIMSLRCLCFVRYQKCVKTPHRSTLSPSISTMFTVSKERIRLSISGTKFHYQSQKIRSFKKKNKSLRILNWNVSNLDSGKISKRSDKNSKGKWKNQNNLEYTYLLHQLFTFFTPNYYLKSYVSQYISQYNVNVGRE